uniref:Vacuolar protein 14 C-terminal Fig4-binding domain-containing protein n=1 Tax=Amphimedon queenslandica TaxID=400682 RepID=A0A1X7URA9_AMPQE
LSLSSTRHLCAFVDAKAVYCTLVEILATEEKLSFASPMVRELNTLPFSSAELFNLRTQLQSMDGP